MQDLFLFKMNLQFYLEKLENSEVFKNFMKRNPNAFLCSGFFVIDKQGKDNKQHFDFFVPENNSGKSDINTKPATPPPPNHNISKNLRVNDKLKNSLSDKNNKIADNQEDIKQKSNMFSFQLENNISLVPLETIEEISDSNKKLNPVKMKLDYDFDFNEIEKLILDKMQREKINSKIQKYIFSLQKIDNKDYLVGTVFISMLGLLKINILLPEKKITRFEKRSVFDIMKVKKNKTFD